MSWTVMPPALLKSARQHGLTLLPAVLHWARLGTKRVFGPVQAALLATTEQMAPRQQAPVVIGHGGGRQVVPLPK